MATEDFGPNEGDHGFMLGAHPDDRDLADERAREAERELIKQAELELGMAKYRALHDRIEDFTRWLIASKILAEAAVTQTGDDFDGSLFEMVEAYLDEVTEHEPTSALDQILNPDLMEGQGEPE